MQVMNEVKLVLRRSTCSERVFSCHSSVENYEDGIITNDNVCTFTFLSLLPFVIIR